MRAPADAAVDVRRYAEADEPRLLTLLQAALAGGPTGDRTSSFFRWKHHANPFGQSLGLVATVGDEIVGARLFMRWAFVARGHAAAAVRAVDTATHPVYQGKGIFRALTMAALDEVRSSSALVFNTPNGQSLPGYLKMGWHVVGQVPIAVRPVRPLRLLGGLRSSRLSAGQAPVADWPLPVASEALADEAALDVLIAEAGSDDSRLHTPRSVAYLRWRYSDASGLGYRALALPGADGLAGLAIGRPRRRGRLVEFTLSELLVRRGDEATRGRLLRAVARSGAPDHVATHFARPAPLASGYFTVPRRGITLVANPLQHLPVDPLSLTSWSFSLGDLEVF